jgi:pyridine nucleotide-disulfide oxidoreductase
MPDATDGRLHVIVVGGGFAGAGCVKRLAGHDRVRVTLIDRNNYHQFQPLLYQVATSQLASSHIAFSLRKLFRRHPNVDVKMAEVVAIDPVAHRHHGGRRPLQGRRGGPGGGIGPQLLPHARGGGPCVSAVLARGRAAPALPNDRCLRGGGRGSTPDRPRRPELRGRRWRADRRRDGRRPGRPHPRDDDRRVSGPRRRPGPNPHRRPGPRAARGVLGHGAPLRVEGADAQGRRDPSRCRGHRGRSGTRHARRRNDDPHALRRLGRPASWRRRSLERPEARRATAAGSRCCPT